MLSFCARKVDLIRCRNIINTKIIGKNRPSNIAQISTARAPELNSDVKPVDQPTVAKADVASYKTLENSKSLKSINKKVSTNNIVKKISAIAEAW